VAFTHGLHNGLLVASVIALAGAVVAVATLRKPQHPDTAPAATAVDRPGHRDRLMSATRPRLTAPEQRQVVLNTACRVFFLSYRGATMAEIARESGITEPILYRHFGSKRDSASRASTRRRAFREVAETALVENRTSASGRPTRMAKSKLRLIDL
jgi:hypothetical protein